MHNYSFYLNMHCLIGNNIVQNLLNQESFKILKSLNSGKIKLIMLVKKREIII